MCERYCGGIHIIRVFRGIRHCIFQPTDTRVCTSTGWIGIDIGVLCALRHFLFCTIFLWVAVPPVFSFGYVFSVCLCDLYLMFAKQFLYIKIDDLKSERERERKEEECKGIFVTFMSSWHTTQSGFLCICRLFICTILSYTHTCTHTPAHFCTI